MPKIERSRDLGHTSLGENYSRSHSAFPSGSCVLNLKSVAQVLLTIGLIVCQKFQGSHDLGHAPFGKIIWAPARLSQMKLYTKFEVSSSSSFEHMFNRIPKILEVTWPRPRPFWRKLFPQMKLHTKFEVSLAQVILTIGSIVYQKF